MKSKELGRFITEKEANAIWQKFKNIPSTVDINKRIHYVCAQSGRSVSSVRRIINAYMSAEQGEAPNTSSMTINRFAEKALGKAKEISTAERFKEKTEKEQDRDSEAEMIISFFEQLFKLGNKKTN